MKILTILGARPQFIKATTVSRAIQVPQLIANIGDVNSLCSALLP
jgi:UDP-N-acetylglucosamine 2-epimerase